MPENGSFKNFNNEMTGGCYVLMDRLLREVKNDTVPFSYDFCKFRSRV